MIKFKSFNGFCEAINNDNISLGALAHRNDIFGNFYEFIKNN